MVNFAEASLMVMICSIALMCERANFFVCLTFMITITFQDACCHKKIKIKILLAIFTIAFFFSTDGLTRFVNHS
jgi:hypothetical protein